MKSLTKEFFKVRDAAHDAVHNGDYYSVRIQASKTTTQTPYELRLSTTGMTVDAHLQVSVEANKAVGVKLIEGITSTGGAGTLITPNNKNRNSTNAATLVTRHTPTATTTGATVLLEDISIPANDRYTIGGEFDDRSEYILKDDEEYLLRVTPGASTADINIVVEWYEK